MPRNLDEQQAFFSGRNVLGSPVDIGLRGEETLGAPGEVPLGLPVGRAAQPTGPPAPTAPGLFEWALPPEPPPFPGFDFGGPGGGEAGIQRGGVPLSDLAQLGVDALSRLFGGGETPAGDAGFYTGPTIGQAAGLVEGGPPELLGDFYGGQTIGQAAGLVGGAPAEPLGGFYTGPSVAKAGGLDLSLGGEALASDFFSTVNPVFAMLGITQALPGLAHLAERALGVKHTIPFPEGFHGIPGQPNAAVDPVSGRILFRSGGGQRFFWSPETQAGQTATPEQLQGWGFTPGYQPVSREQEIEAAKALLGGREPPAVAPAPATSPYAGTPPPSAPQPELVSYGGGGGQEPFQAARVQGGYYVPGADQFVPTGQEARYGLPAAVVQPEH